ncbi:heparinase II/III domain-containing protein [Petrimonas sp.]|uniref:heparinase II/III domain-containing protein n=1 Tax=Petrimonas sp. TaxID=2023866 RepID=UPI003F515A19
MKKIIFLILVAFIFLSANTCDKDQPKVEEPKTENNKNGHPRILLLEGEEKQIKDLIAADATWKKMHNTIIEECNTILTKPELERVMVGRRLLGTSRELLKRVFYLSYGYRMTGDVRYFNKAEKEMLAVSRFSDWNPSHFLDVAEMTMGVAIGYDWLYAALSDNSKSLIKEAILNKGLNPSKDSKYNSWLKVENNWNQVCNAGMTFGALAIQEDYPVLANEIIERAFKSIPLSMDAYKPDGVYPEGYGYWGYGTTFTILFLNAVEKALGSDRGLSLSAGFLQTADFIKHMITPTARNFNWSDNGLGAGLSPAMFWFAEKTKNPSVLWSGKQFLEADNFSRYKGIRELPAIMIWGKNILLSNITEPKEKFWAGQGDNPVAMMRTSWSDPNAIYLGFKTGSASVNHGHMDIGSFVMEADGVRWASDPGMQDYESLESKGMSIFGRTQDAQRWTIYRMNNHSHNVITINGQLQQVKGYGKIDKFSGTEGFNFAMSDISSVYEGQMKKVVRGVAIKDYKYVVVRDEVETLGNSTKLKWAIFTFADVEIGNKSAVLTLNNKKLHVKIQGPKDIVMKTWSTAPTTDYDAANPGTVMVGFECTIPADTKETFEVLLIPEKSMGDASFLNKTLQEW